jgi:Carbamoylphosphate synthase large subunit (split gene in MJ)
VVTKIPRFAFEKFPTADSRLTTQMKSVGEVMAMGRTFQESFQKALRGLEVGVDGMNEKTQDREVLEKELGEPGPERIWYVGDAFAMGLSVDEVFDLTKIDKWFLVQIEQIVKIELELDQLAVEKGDAALAALDAATLHTLKQKGFSDRRLAKLLKTTEKAVREARRALKVRPVYKRVDTCAAEFATNTAYLYSTYEVAPYGGVAECEAEPTNAKKIMVLGGGPNRIGRASSSTIAACTRPLPCARMVMKPSWSTATLKRFRPTTTPRTACISSPSHWKTCWKSSTRKSRWA